MNKISNTAQTKFPYLVTALGVGLMAVVEVYSYVRTMMLRAMFQAGGDYGAGLAAGRQFNRGFGFGGTNVLTILAIIVAIAGLVWLGLALRKSPKIS